MSPTAASEKVVPASSEQSKCVDRDPEPSHDLPARTTTIPESERHEVSAMHKEDPATMAASEELKHTTISDKTKAPRVRGSADEPAGEDKIAESTKTRTPDKEVGPLDLQDEEMKERILSPKKKRGRDQDEDAKAPGDDVVEPGSSADGSVANGSRTTRSEPEKKRPRDNLEELPKSAEKSTKVIVTYYSPPFAKPC